MSRKQTNSQSPPPTPTRPQIPSDAAPPAESDEPTGTRAAESPAQSKRKALSFKKLDELMARAEKGNEKAIAEFQAFLDEDGNPAWRAMGDLANLAEKSLAKQLFAESRSAALSVSWKFNDLRRQLAEDNATPLEKLAADRVILASMFATAVDIVIANGGSAAMTSERAANAPLQAEKRVSEALRSLKLAREISRAAVASAVPAAGAKAAASPPAASPPAAGSQPAAPQPEGPQPAVPEPAVPEPEGPESAGPQAAAM